MAAAAHGLRAPRQVYHTGENPFRDGTTRRVRTVTGGATGRAVWQADIPERGEYAVYVSYESTQSADDAHYTVRHLGGLNLVCRQSDDGRRDVDLPRAFFPSPPDGREVVTLIEPFAGGRAHRLGRRGEDRRRLRQRGPHVLRLAAPARRGHAGETSGYPVSARGRALVLASVGGISGRRSIRRKTTPTTTRTTTCRAPIGSMP